MQDLTKRLIAIDSVTGCEGEIAHFLADELHRRGLRTRLDEVFPNRPNLLAWYDTPEPQILFNTHIDTVPPQYGPHETDQRIYGRGACDTHGILAAMLEAMEVLHTQGVGGLGLILVVDEEGGQHRGAQHAGKNLSQPSILIVGEPTENKMITSQKGLLKADLSAVGVEGHSGYPELFDSALRRLLKAIDALEAQDWMASASTDGTTMNVHIKQGGDAYNKIPGFAQAGLFIRLIEPQQAVKQRVEQALHELNDEKVTIEWLGGNDPVDYLATLPGFDTGVAAFNTDIAHFRWRECKTFLFGPGSILQAHRDMADGDWDRGEWIDKAEQARGAELYVELVHKALET